MAFSMTVYRTADRAFLAAAPAVDDPTFDAWMTEAQARTLFSAPLGSEGAVATRWHGDAQALGLRLLGSIYDRGLEIVGDDLDNALAELGVLETRWLETVGDGIPPVTWQYGHRRVEVPVLADLMWRVESFRSALQLAKAIDGYVVVS